MLIQQGFLLQKQWQDINGQLQLTFWFKQQKQVTQITINNAKAIFFIEQQHALKAKQSINRIFAQKQNVEFKNVNLKNFNHQTMTAVYFNSQKELYLAAKTLNSIGISTYESDVNPCNRFLMERFIHGGASWGAAEKAINHKTHQQLINPKLKSCSYQPQLLVMSLDIETSIVDGRLLSIAMTTHQYEHSSQQLGDQNSHTQVFLLDNQQNTPINHTKICEDETSLLKDFVDYFNHINPDIIIGWSVVNFDFQFLQHKSEELNVPLNIGRHQEPIKWVNKMMGSDAKTAIISGRVIVDGIDAVKSATISFERYSLDFVSNQLLGRGKLIDHVEDRALPIVKMFENDPTSLVEYNIEDCLLVWQIFIKADLFGYLLQREELTGLTLERFGGSVAAFEFRYLPLLHRAGFIAPNVPEDPEGIGSPGGYVLESKPGIYKNILVFDYKSLYPSIIRTFGIDPLALAIAQHDLKLTPIKDQQPTFLTPINNYVISGFNGAAFDKRSAILPELILELWQARDEAKRQNQQAKSQALKIIMNSFYGVLGTPGCRFFNFQLPSSITLRGHEILTTSQHWFEAQGLNVIYGDTDSIFVELNQSLSNEQITARAKQLESSLNEYWQRNLKEQYQVNCHLELEFECHYSDFVMPTIRGSDKGSKKRYAGLISGDVLAEDIIFKGLEVARSDWSLLAKEFQRQLYFLVFKKQSCATYIQHIVAQLKNGEHDKKLILKKKLRKPIESFVKIKPPHIQALIKATDHKVRPGMNIQYVMTNQGPELVTHQRHPIDYQYYIDKQIAPIADDLLSFLGSSFEKEMGNQQSLF